MTYHIKAPVGAMQSAVRLPASKSISNRILILNALSEHPCEILNLSDCDDTGAMLRALQSGEPHVDVGAAGTAMRFLTAYLSGKRGQWTLTGTERMKNRPIRILVDALRTLGAIIEYAEKEGFPPLRIEGRRLQGGEVWLDGGVSSQYISALLMVAPLMSDGLKLHLTGNLISKPYLRLTVRLMRCFGATVFEEGQTFTVSPQRYAPVPFTVEADWSAASYWYEIAALSERAEIELNGLSADSLQGDAAIAPLFDRLGVETVYTPKGVLLRRIQRAQLQETVCDFTDIPDMAQTFAVTCATLGIPFSFSGLQSLKIKETDRLTALCTELRKFGYRVEERDGSILTWDGSRGEAESAPVVATYEDHRMAMAFAPMAMCFADGIRMTDIEVVSKSYPGFWDDLRQAGFSVEKIRLCGIL
ncbi:MAG: 3-phosphoshikimate 1-carboxyvinyltransferase [Tannerella sp.]|jgi:3-phosphoshikimate 1-carboxyvinyltransferase|nr:3-phosphoshikimate 1-carboxyvinyltransferase [Tannerella sp.]